MKPINHHLRNYRKNSIFNQQDIAELLGTQDVIQVSQNETNTIHPQIELMLLYHILYKVPLNKFFPEQEKALIKRLQMRIPNIIDEWKCLTPNDVVTNKINYLRQILTDLNHPTNL
jgi:transcriptional regulator with XRE-family HTH domain